MRLQSLAIQNFRALENININFKSAADVIVGPNAVGKTTVLEAIRLAKAILSPRTLDESQTVLISLGAASPHNPQQINFPALARDPGKPITVNCRYELSADEVNALDSLVPALANLIVQANLGMDARSPLALVQFLSTPQGQTAHANARAAIMSAIPNYKASKTCTLNLTIDPRTRNMSGADQLSQMIFTALEGRLPYHQALFSYFPADRAMPTGDTPIQIGGPDISAQLASHNSNPQTKYHRLKTTIVNNYVLSAANPTEVISDFNKIFSNLLKDREIGGIQINQFGLVSIRVKDLLTNQLFDIDGMSSGEKGLILTFLLIGRGLAQDGILIIDEPELHLNPAVCKVLLPFLIDQYLLPKNIQAIICSHSPEILGVAFERSDCALHHLQAPTVISPILPEDKDEVFGALRRLGTTTSDVLFSSGSIFVEGDDDIDVLDAGFSKKLTRYKVTQLGGRNNVEQDIKTLQQVDARNELDSLKCFIFDLDNAPTNLTSTRFVRVHQWKRRCIENYLINEKIIYDLLKDTDIATTGIASRGEVTEAFKALALAQLDDTIADLIYKRMTFENIGPPKRNKLIGKSFADSAAYLFSRLSALQQQVCNLNQVQWCSDFEQRCQGERAILHPKWEQGWVTLCDGKRFFLDLHKQYGVKIKPIKFKVRIMEKMERERTDEWVLIESILTDALRPASANK